GQLSASFAAPSPSRSPSHASPAPSPSESSWFGLATPLAQLSQASPMPSPSESVWSRLEATGHVSLPSALPSPSASSVSESVLPSSVYCTHTEPPPPPPPPSSLGEPHAEPRHSGLSCASAGAARARLAMRAREARMGKLLLNRTSCQANVDPGVGRA